MSSRTLFMPGYKVSSFTNFLCGIGTYDKARLGRVLPGTYLNVIVAVICFGRDEMEPSRCGNDIPLGEAQVIGEVRASLIRVVPCCLRGARGGLKASCVLESNVLLWCEIR